MAREGRGAQRHYGSNRAPSDVGLCIGWVLDDRWHRCIGGGPACLRGALLRGSPEKGTAPWDVLESAPRQGTGEGCGEFEVRRAWRAPSRGVGAPRGPRPPLSPRLTQIRVLQNTVRHVVRKAVQAPAFLAEKDLAARTAPAAGWSSRRLQYARLFCEALLPAGGDRRSVHRAVPFRPGCDGSLCRLSPGSRPHLSTGATRLPSSAKGLSQPQKPLPASRSSATRWVLDSWRSGQ